MPATTDLVHDMNDSDLGDDPDAESEVSSGEDSSDDDPLLAALPSLSNEPTTQELKKVCGAINLYLNFAVSDWPSLHVAHCCLSASPGRNCQGLPQTEGREYRP